MAHEIMANDGLILAGKPAWHGLGTVVESAPSIPAALALAGLDWRVESVELDTVERKRVLSHVANVRSDTREILGIVGTGYEPFQNDRLAQFASDLMGAGAKVESAGSIRNGRRVWFLIRTEEVIELGRTGGDKVVPYVLLANGHDGSLACWIQPTTVRVVCSNTFHAALGAKNANARAGKSLRLRHTSDIGTRVDQAREVLANCGIVIRTWAEQARALAAFKPAKAELYNYFDKVYAGAFSKPESDRGRTRRDNVISEWKVNLHDSRQAVDGIDGSAWAAFNSITDWADHRSNAKADRDERHYSAWFGGAADVKAEAWSAALELAGVEG